MAVYWQRQDRAHWKDQLALRDAALIVFQYGTNESDLWKLDRDEYEQALAGLVDELREAARGASVLVVAPLDRAEDKDGRLATKRVILDLVTIQKRVALSHGAAFWNTFDAMGGEGSMARWVKTKPQLGGGDLTHPTPLGAEVLGDMLSQALVDAYERVEERGRLVDASQRAATPRCTPGLRCVRRRKAALGAPLVVRVHQVAGEAFAMYAYPARVRWMRSRDARESGSVAQATMLPGPPIASCWS